MRISSLRQPSTILLLASFLIFLAFQIYITAGPMLERAVPVEIDDAYSYLIKAEEMRSCAFQECPALTDLHAQFTAEAEDPDVGYIQIREYHRLFVVYQPLQSFGLIMLSSLGLDYHTAYVVLAIAFKLLLCAAIALWLRAILGNLGAAAGLLLLAPIIFVGTGIHTIVPGTMALATCLLLWAAIFNGEKRPIVLLPLIVATILLHDIGKIYVGMGLLALLFLSPRPYAKNVRLSAIIGFVLVFVALVGSFVIQQPEFRFDPTEFYPGMWNYADELVRSLGSSLQIALLWLNSFGHAAIAIGLVLVGVASLQPETRLKWLTMFVLLLGLLGLGFVYVVPWFGAFVFERAWVPTGIFLTATIAAGVFRSITEVWRSVGKSMATSRRNLLVWGGALGLFVFALFTYLPFYIRHYHLTYNNQLDRQDIRFDKSQPALIFDQGQQTSVIYKEEIPFYYYVVNGGFAHNAIYYPVAREFNEFRDEIAVADYVVARNAIFDISENEDMHIVMDDFSTLLITRLDGEAIRELHIEVRTSANKVPVKLTWIGPNEAVEDLDQLSTGTVVLASPNSSANALAIKLRAGNEVRVSGLSFGNAIQTNWPWSEGVGLELTTSFGTVTYAELSEQALASGLPFTIRVIDDDGYTVLAEAVR